jgi:hypothetical protein
VFTSRKKIIAMAAAATAVLVSALTLALTGPATAAPTPSAATWFQLKSGNLPNICLVEKGATDAVYGAGCSANHSDYWKRTSAGELVNLHSGECLSVTGTAHGVYANVCTGNHAQLWNTHRVAVIAAGKPYYYTEYVNVHAGLSLGLVPSVAGIGADQVAWGDTLWVSQ